MKTKINNSKKQPESVNSGKKALLIELPLELHSRLKSKAALSNKGLYQYIISLLEKIA